MSKVKLDIYNFKSLHAEILNIIDGDTLDLLIDYGVCIITQRARLLGVDAPEKTGWSRHEGQLAKTVIETLLPVGSVVTVNSYGKDMYGRLLCRIIVSKFDLSEFLIDNKVCNIYKIKGKRKWTREELDISANASIKILNSQSIKYEEYGNVQCQEHQ